MHIKKWRRVTHEGMGISVEIGRLSYSQKPLLAVMAANVLGPLMAAVGKDGEEPDAASMAKQSAALGEAFSHIDPELVADVFEHKVRKVEGLHTEDGPVTTGKEFLEVADQPMLFWVLTSLVNVNEVSAEEGKASVSPSISNSGETVSFDSPVAPTAKEGGPSLSTVTEIPAGAVSSTPVA